MKDFISREEVCNYIAEFINNPYSTQDECEMVDAMINGIQHMPSAKPQEHILDKIRAEIDSAEMPKNQMSFFRDGINCALQIIDKYKKV